MYNFDLHIVGEKGPRGTKLELEWYNARAPMDAEEGTWFWLAKAAE